MNRILAALIFFTRLPFWKIKEVPRDHFKHIVSYWSISGWLTGGVMALVFWGVSHILPPGTAVIAALVSRLLITGALHEDGLADFFDGFGGGTDKESTLRIMKDSHIGSYGVLGLIIYYLLACHLLPLLPVTIIPFILLGGDAWSKSVSSNIINFLPYARTAEASKSGTIYTRMNIREIIISAAGGILPLIMVPADYRVACLFPIITFLLILRMLKRRLDGYTGDCCGALFLFCELSFWLGAALCNNPII
ncbi:adenosylcobinamide-GDP ribazoletransferase [uncultured Bacteroides sp.]|uniref:adenosylcobinamide-GDP ribazoletransferase n=1 Tax=uncultured Bacteroides sp. TaxID=162156 RepID=UPI0026772CB5|nr:adenosylcobinamide-GDP ribazoletransferase [uncultured Bacteroides sp.]